MLFRSILCRAEFELNLGPFIPDALWLIIDVSSGGEYHSAGISISVGSANSYERFCINFSIKLGSSVNKNLENIQAIQEQCGYGKRNYADGATSASPAAPSDMWFLRCFACSSPSQLELAKNDGVML